MNLNISNPIPLSYERPQYESYATNEVIGYSWEYLGWTDDTVKVIDRVLKELRSDEPPTATGLPHLPPDPDTKKGKAYGWLLGKREEHKAWMNKVLGKPTSEVEARYAVDRYNSWNHL